MKKIFALMVSMMFVVAFSGSTFAEEKAVEAPKAAEAAKTAEPAKAAEPTKTEAKKVKKKVKKAAEPKKEEPKK